MVARSHVAAVLALAAISALPRAAAANGTHLPDVIDVVLRPGDTDTVVIEGNFGLLESRAGGPFHWICHETITTLPGALPAYAWSADGVLLASARVIGFGNDPQETLYRSEDGCTWTTVSGLTGVSIAAVAFDPSDPSHAFAAAANGGAGVRNALWESHDAGATWAKTPIEVDHYVYGVRFAGADPQVVWATSSDPSELEGWVYRSTNGGVSFATHPWTQVPTGTALGSMQVIATSPFDPDEAWVRTYGIPHRLWRTTNGGVAFHLVLAPGGIRDVDVLPDGRMWVATVNSGLFLSLDGTTFTQEAQEPGVRGFAHDSRGLFAATDPYLDPFTLTLSTSGDPRTARGLFRLEDLAGPKPCADGTTVANVCPALWPAMQVRLGIAPPRVPLPVTKLSGSEDGGGKRGGCQCTSAAPAGGRSGASAALALLGLGILAIRRVARSGVPESRLEGDRVDHRRRPR